jgi:alpha-glucosidase (family GH31 glycosyl hydrolase)
VNVVDDSWRPLLDGNPEWDWVIPRNSSNIDWYFFGHGHNYRQALNDFTKVALDIPLPPRYTFGIFWSRYWGTKIWPISSLNLTISS